MNDMRSFIQYQGKKCLAVGLLLMLFVLVYDTVGAQSGGQFCVRAFDDRNGNGLFDGGEPLLSRGLSLNLMDAQNVTVASALLDQSPTAAQGVVCFQRLSPGQYTITVTSAEFKATTPAAFTTTINDTSVEVVQYGAQSITASAAQPPAASAATGTLDRTQLARIVLSALGALVVIAGMVMLGFIVYYFVIRNRRSAVKVVDQRRTTGSIPPVSTIDTGEVPKA